jgi:competence protein ComEC
MGILHFLDVGQGDCSIIQHGSGRVSIIDVCKARKVPALLGRSGSTILGEFWQDQRGEIGGRATILGRSAVTATSADHTNPIAYLQKIGVTDVHRFVSSTRTWIIWMV